MFRQNRGISRPQIGVSRTASTQPDCNTEAWGKPSSSLKWLHQTIESKESAPPRTGTLREGHFRTHSGWYLEIRVVLRVLPYSCWPSSAYNSALSRESTSFLLAQDHTASQPSHISLPCLNRIAERRRNSTRRSSRRESRLAKQGQSSRKQQWGYSKVRLHLSSLSSSWKGSMVLSPHGQGHLPITPLDIEHGAAKGGQPWLSEATSR